MSESPDAEKGSSPEEQIWDAISAFEQILEALPEDRTSLETLSGAYEQIGDHARAKDYLVRLGEVLLKEMDYDAAVSLVDRLRTYSEYDSGINDLISRIERHGGPSSTEAETAKAASPSANEVSSDVSLSKFSIAAEMSMAWNLMEAEELTQDEYALVVQDLTEMSSQREGGTISTLHVLEAHEGLELERIMVFLSRECDTPIISLDSFEFNMDTMLLLPREFMVERGALVFELLGSDALVAILNPYDPEIRKDVKTTLGRDCHFYLSVASQFDRHIEHLDDATEGETE